jgi:hypothetical protein
VNGTPYSLPALTALTDEELRIRRATSWARVRAARQDVSVQNLLVLLQDATAHHAINASGVVVRPAGIPYRLRVELVAVRPAESIVVSLLTEAGDEVTGLEWTPDRTAAQLIADLDEALDYNADDPNLRLDASALAGALIDTAQLGLEAHRTTCGRLSKSSTGSGR